MRGSESAGRLGFQFYFWNRSWRQTHVPIPARDYTSGSSGHHVIAPTHSVSKEEVRCFHDRRIAGFVERMDASHVIHLKFGRMLLSNGLALGWCDRRNYPPRLHRALPNPHDVRAAQEQEETHRGVSLHMNTGVWFRAV